MKPLPGDHRHRLLITGDELRELKKHIYSMAEAFGLDRKIDNYQGSRPITLYRWDLDCLMDVIALALQDEQDYPDSSAPGYQALKRLGERLHQEYDTVYGGEKSPLLVQKTSKVPGSTEKPAVLGQAPNLPSPVYQLKITLTGSKPRIWRCIEIGDCTLLKLHKILQVSMGWDDRHAWAVFIGDQEYGDDVVDAGGDREFKSARKVKLSSFVQAGVKEFLYTYDLAEGWEHVIRVEKVLDSDPQVRYPRCVNGSRGCPPEDCGGPRGYMDFLDALLHPKHESHKDVLEWIGGTFDPEAFDREAVNKALTRVR